MTLLTPAIQTRCEPGPHRKPGGTRAFGVRYELGRALRSALTAALALHVVQPAVATTAMTRVVSNNPHYVLFKPNGWPHSAVARGSQLSIRVETPDHRAGVEVEFTDNRARHVDARRFMTEQLQAIKARHRDLTVTAASVCHDQPASCAVASVTMTVDGVPSSARHFFHADSQIATRRSYRAPADRLASERALLLDVLTNIHVLERKPVTARFVRRTAADRSSSMELPEDWTFLAQKGTVLAAAPQGRAGFVLMPFSVLPQNYGVQPPPGVIIAPYRPPQAIVHDIFAQFRNRQTRVLAAQTDAATASQCPARIGRQCEAADLLVAWVSPEGVPCTGGFKIINARPSASGQWFTLIAGIWGPDDDLSRHLPVLERVAGSFAIDDAYARRYIEEGMARVRAQEARTRQAISELYGAIEQNQRDYEARSARQDAMNARWDDYRRGNSYWVSDLEGGKVYRTDPWGTQDTSSGTRYDGPPFNYIHFEGQNPAHASEHMREISSYELQQMNR